MRILLAVSLVWVLYTIDYWGQVQTLEFDQLSHCQKSMTKLNLAGVPTSVCSRVTK